MKNKLRPCPFCGDDSVTIVGSKSAFDRQKKYYAWCINCNSQNDKKESVEAAEKDWNAARRRKA